jgi:membrane-bound inhibitor of C-type lysozyme
MRLLRCCLIAAALSGVLAAPVRAQVPAAVPAAEPTPYTSDTRVYRCAGPRLVSVVYLNVKGAEPMAVLSWRGRLHLMRGLPSDTGARYASVDEAAGVRWRTVGETGFLGYLAPDHMAREQPLARDCKAEPR